MARPVANQRLFVALYPPREVADKCLEMLKAMDLPKHRPVAAEQIHLTLQFIGDTPAKDLDRVIESVMRSAGGIRCFELTIEKLAPVPVRGPARLIAAHTDSPGELLEMQRRLATRLAKNRRDKVGDRFLPHITLCRFRSPRRDRPGDLLLDGDAAMRFAVDSICLMRSILHQDGPEHIEVSRVTLV